MLKKLWRWLPVALWLCVIWWFSSHTGERSGNLSGGLTEWLLFHVIPRWDTFSAATRENWLITGRYLIRKGAHMTEFAILAMLLFHAWYDGKRPLRRVALLTAPCCLLAAMADEFHQAFVPARGPSIGDVFIDFTGALLGILLVLLVVGLVRRCRWAKE